MVAHLISPLVAAAFAVVYWVIGMYNVMNPGTQWVKNSRSSNGVFFVYFPHFNFPFFRVRLCICRSRLLAAELYLYGPERKSPFLILMIAPHIGPETLSRVWILRMCIHFTLLPRNIFFGILCCTNNQTDSKDCFDTQPSKYIFQMWQNRS